MPSGIFIRTGVRWSRWGNNGGSTRPPIYLTPCPLSLPTAGRPAYRTGRLEERGMEISLRRVKSGKALQYSTPPNPNGVERLIAPGETRGTAPHDSWNPASSTEALPTGQAGLAKEEGVQLPPHHLVWYYLYPMADVHDKATRSYNNLK
jgi:hypothetical protein